MTFLSTVFPGSCYSCYIQWRRMQTLSCLKQTVFIQPTFSWSCISERNNNKVRKKKLNAVWLFLSLCSSVGQNRNVLLLHIWNALIQQEFLIFCQVHHMNHFSLRFALLFTIEFKSVSSKTRHGLYYNWQPDRILSVSLHSLRQKHIGVL